MKTESIPLQAQELKVEPIKMDQDVVKLLNRILDQNEKVLQQNAIIIETLARPLMVATK